MQASDTRYHYLQISMQHERCDQCLSTNNNVCYLYYIIIIIHKMSLYIIKHMAKESCHTPVITHIMKHFIVEDKFSFLMIFVVRHVQQ